MSEQSFFENTLSNFTHEVANGGAIRHLTDLGYTVKQISEQLSFPTSTERLRQQVWERLVDTEIILTEEPGSNIRQKADYVREYDKFGRASFRRVVKTTEDTVVCWQNLDVDCRQKEKLSSLIEKKIAENGETRAYTACEFGILIQKEPKRFHELLGVLDKNQREYIEGLPWETKCVYHRLNFRMLEILLQLLAEGLWQGDCYFLKTKERVHFVKLL